jgi:MFS family permease
MNSAEVYAVPARRTLSKHYPWILIGLLWMVAFLNAADRSILVAVMPKLRDEFGLTPERLALINSVFFWIYAFAAFLSGRLGDSTRRSWVIVGGLAFWSVATGLVSLATGFTMLLALRGMVALGEATYYPTGTALISDWHRPAMRSRALSIHQTAVLAGTGFGAYAAGLIADRLGWQAPFVIFAAAGIVWCGVLYKALQDAPSRAAHERSETRKSLLGPLRVVVKRPPALFLCSVFFLGTGASTGVSVWAPTYVHDALGLDLADSALYGAATISVAGLIMVPFGGLIADWLGARSAMSIGLVLLASSAGKGIFDGCIYSTMHDVVPSEARASAVGLMTMSGFIGAGLTPLFVAMASRVWGMAAGLTSLAALYFIAVIILLAIRGTTRRVVLETRRAEEAAVT